jgi:hypothetical protein
MPSGPALDRHDACTRACCAAATALMHGAIKAYFLLYLLPAVLSDVHKEISKVDFVEIFHLY